jgi:intracellular septation protein
MKHRQSAAQAGAGTRAAQSVLPANAGAANWLLGSVPSLAGLADRSSIRHRPVHGCDAGALAVSWLLTRKLPIMPLVSGVVVVVFGALTLWLQDDIFIKMKPTIVNTLFGVVLLGGLCFGKSLLGYVFDSVFKPRRMKAGAS